MASTYLSRTPSSSGNLRTWTFSAWFKKSSGGFMLGVADMTDGDPGTTLEVGDTVLFGIYNGGHISRLYPSNLTRDVSGWYHYVVAVDTTQATESDRVKIYINGTQITSFSTEIYPPQNYDTMVNSSSYEHRIGDRGGQSFDGSMTHIHLTDGTQYQASDFGEFDSNGVWKPKTSPSVTYGTNGFFLKMENSGSMGTDSSGNANNFTVNGNLTQTLDTPSNVYCTLNPLTNTGVTVSNGNLKGVYSTNDANLRCTLGVNKGKWYWESKVLGTASGLLYGIIIEGTPQTVGRADSAGIYGLQNAGTSFAYADTDGTRATSAGFPNPVANDIVQCALDLDNDKFYMGINGTFYDLSGTTANPATGSNPTWTLNSNYDGLIWFPFYEFRSSAESTEINFGNGYFGTTAVSSAGSNGNGSIFEYDVPSGYYALNTKNLATYG